MANLEGMSTCFMSLNSKTRGIIDSGASDHMTYGFKSLESPITCANNHLLSVKIMQ